VRKSPPARTYDLPPLEAALRRYWRRPSFAEAHLKNLSGTPAGLSDSVGPQDAPADKPREWRTVGPIEQKLRAANKRAWIESTNGWSDFFGRFRSSSKDKTS